jgi:hypothetical protein
MEGNKNNNFGDHLGETLTVQLSLHDSYFSPQPKQAKTKLG